MQEDIKKKRHEYTLKQLNEQDVDQNPFVQFDAWFKMALEANLPDANAMTLATVNSEGKPRARILLLKDYSDDGYCFFTNYKSKKGEDLKLNSYAAMLFFWPQLEKQIRIEGRIERLEPEHSDRYFMARPVGSRRAAAVSPQSSVIEGREELVQAIEEHKKKYGEAFKRPDFCGGYILLPERFEFWQGRENRLNDRIEYIPKDNNLISHRLAP